VIVYNLLKLQYFGHLAGEMLGNQHWLCWKALWMAKRYWGNPLKWRTERHGWRQAVYGRLLTAEEDGGEHLENSWRRRQGSDTEFAAGLVHPWVLLPDKTIPWRMEKQNLCSWPSPQGFTAWRRERGSIYPWKRVDPMSERSSANQEGEKSAFCLYVPAVRAWLFFRRAWRDWPSSRLSAAKVEPIEIVRWGLRAGLVSDVPI